jgi:hypothetical protein
MAADPADRALLRLREAALNDVGLPAPKGIFITRGIAGVISALVFGIVLALVMVLGFSAFLLDQLKESNSEADCRALIAADHIVAFGSYVIADGGVDTAVDALFLEAFGAASEGRDLTPEELAGFEARYADARLERLDKLQEFMQAQVVRLNAVGACAG